MKQIFKIVRGTNRSQSTRANKTTPLCDQTFLSSKYDRKTHRCGCKLTSVKVVEYVDPSTGTREEQKAKRLERERYWIIKIQPKINPLQNL